jgi:hypothetical protein
MSPIPIQRLTDRTNEISLPIVYKLSHLSDCMLLLSPNAPFSTALSRLENPRIAIFSQAYSTGSAAQEFNERMASCQEDLGVENIIKRPRITGPRFSLLCVLVILGTASASNEPSFPRHVRVKRGPFR